MKLDYKKQRLSRQLENIKQVSKPFRICVTTYDLPGCGHLFLLRYNPEMLGEVCGQDDHLDLVKPFLILVSCHTLHYVAPWGDG